MEDTGYSGYVWDRSTIRTAMVLGSLFVFTVLILLSSYEIHLNSLQRIAIEQAASEILGSKVSIGGYYPRPKKNLIVFTEVKIANPPDLKMGDRYSNEADQAIKIGIIRMKADSLSAGKMVFSEVTFENGMVHLLVNRYQVNLLALHEKMHSKATVGAAKIIIKQLNTERMALRPWVARPDRNYGSMTMEPLYIKAIGEKEGGVTIAEALTQVVDEVFRHAFMKAARTDILSDVSKESLAEIQKAMNLDPRFVDMARRGTEDWGDWKTRDFIKSEESLQKAR